MAIFLTPNYDTDIAIERHRAEEFERATEQAERMLNENILACEEAVKGEKRVRNAMCQKYKIKNCEVPERVSSSLQYGYIDGCWMTGNNIIGYSCL